MFFRSRFLFAVFALGVTGCDHATKVLAASALERVSIDLIPGLLSLDRAHNTDTAFGLLEGLIALEPRLLLLKATATIGALVLFIVACGRFRHASNLERVSFALLLGGAAGNAIDRWRWGYVIDFIRLPHWPTFNVADIALTVGAALLAYLLIKPQTEPIQPLL